MHDDVWEVLALIVPFAIIFGLGAVLIIGPILRSQGERYQNRPSTDAETPSPTNLAARSGPGGETPGS